MNYRTEKERQFDEIYCACEDDIYRISLYYTRNRMLAKEVAEQTFINFYSEFEKITPEKRRVYLMKMARDLALKKRTERDKK